MVADGTNRLFSPKYGELRWDPKYIGLAAYDPNFNSRANKLLHKHLTYTRIRLSEKHIKSHPCRGIEKAKEKIKKRILSSNLVKNLQ